MPYGIFYSIRTIRALTKALEIINNTSSEQSEAIGMLAHYASEAAGQGGMIPALRTLTKEEKAATDALVDALQENNAMDSLLSIIGLLGVFVPYAGAASVAGIAGIKFQKYVKNHGGGGPITKFMEHFYKKLDEPESGWDVVQGFGGMIAGTLMMPLWVAELGLQALGWAANEATPNLLKSEMVAPLTAYVLGQAACVMMGKDKAESLLARQMEYGESQARGRG